MNALVTGADGFLGANLCQHLQEQGHEVIGTALNRKRETSLDALGVEVGLEYGNVLDPTFLQRVVNAYEVDWVFHLAGVSIVRVAENSPYRAIQTNALGTLNMLEAARQSGTVKAVVIASSDKAYGDYEGIPYQEDMPLDPSGAYEVSKACADQIARCYAEYGVKAMVARCANLYGRGDLHWSRLIPGSCKRAFEYQAPRVTPGAWMYEREWLHVEDACRAYRMIAERGVPGRAYNVGSGEIYPVGVVAAMVSELMCAPVPESSKRRIEHEIPTQCLDCGRIRSELHWEPSWRFNEGLEDTTAWYTEYLEARG